MEAWSVFTFAWLQGSAKGISLSLSLSLSLYIYIYIYIYIYKFDECNYYNGVYVFPHLPWGHYCRGGGACQTWNQCNSFPLHFYIKIMWLAHAFFLIIFHLFAFSFRWWPILHVGRPIYDLHRILVRVNGPFGPHMFYQSTTSQITRLVCVCKQGRTEMILRSFRVISPWLHGPYPFSKAHVNMMGFQRIPLGNVDPSLCEWRKWRNPISPKGWRVPF